MKNPRPGEARMLVRAHEVNSREAWAQPPEVLTTGSLILPLHVWQRACQAARRAAGKARGRVPMCTV